MPRNFRANCVNTGNINQRERVQICNLAKNKIHQPMNAKETSSDYNWRNLLTAKKNIKKIKKENNPLKDHIFYYNGFWRKMCNWYKHSTQMINITLTSFILHNSMACQNVCSKTECLQLTKQNQEMWNIVTLTMNIKQILHRDELELDLLYRLLLAGDLDLDLERLLGGGLLRLGGGVLQWIIIKQSIKNPVSKSKYWKKHLLYK